MRIPLVAAALLASAGSQVPLRSVIVEENWRNLTLITSPPGDESRVFVLEQNTANVMLVKDGNFQFTPFLSLNGLTSTGAERGLLGLAFHPRYAQNGRFYVYFTRAGDSGVMLVRYQRSAANPDLADPTSAVTILGPLTRPVFSDHNAGSMQFGPDGYLYVSIGDGGHTDNNNPDPNCNAQNPLSLFGKILRLDVDGGTPYAIPPGNPFVGNPGYRPEIWALGLRNPWRMSFDRTTGDLWIGDVGHETREEINFQPAGVGGRNYGWKIMEGTTCFPHGSGCAPTLPPCQDPVYTPPVYEYDHNQGCAVIGGFVYRGCAIPELRGTYFFSDYCANKIWSFRLVNGQVTQFTDRTAQLQLPAPHNFTGITAFGEDARGEIMFCSYSGKGYRIAAAAPAPATDLGSGSASANGIAPRFDACGLLDRNNSAEFRLFRAATITVAVLALGTQNNPTRILDGTLVPYPPQLLPVFITGPDGTARFTMAGGGGPFDVYGQFLVVDPAAPDSVAFSNALRITFRP
jgi:glucose/arabinose dehydrogenase